MISLPACFCVKFQYSVQFVPMTVLAMNINLILSHSRTEPHAGAVNFGSTTRLREETTTTELLHSVPDCEVFLGHVVFDTSLSDSCVSAHETRYCAHQTWHVLWVWVYWLYYRPKKMFKPWGYTWGKKTDREITSFLWVVDRRCFHSESLLLKWLLSSVVLYNICPSHQELSLYLRWHVQIWLCKVSEDARW